MVVVVDTFIMYEKKTEKDIRRVFCRCRYYCPTVSSSVFFRTSMARVIKKKEWYDRRRRPRIFSPKFFRSSHPSPNRIYITYARYTYTHARVGDYATNASIPKRFLFLT